MVMKNRSKYLFKDQKISDFSREGNFSNHFINCIKYSNQGLTLLYWTIKSDHINPNMSELEWISCKNLHPDWDLKNRFRLCFSPLTLAQNLSKDKWICDSQAAESTLQSLESDSHSPNISGEFRQLLKLSSLKLFTQRPLEWTRNFAINFLPNRTLNHIIQTYFSLSPLLRFQFSGAAEENVFACSLAS